MHNLNMQIWEIENDLEPFGDCLRKAHRYISISPADNYILAPG